MKVALSKGQINTWEVKECLFFQEDKIFLTQIAGDNHKFNGKVSSFGKPGDLHGRDEQCHANLYMEVVLGGSGIFFGKYVFAVPNNKVQHF